MATTSSPRISRMAIVPAPKQRPRCWLDDRSHYLTLVAREQIAAFLQASGARPKCSSDVAGEFTYGYGNGPDELGYWEYILS